MDYKVGILSPHPKLPLLILKDDYDSARLFSLASICFILAARFLLHTASRFQISREPNEVLLAVKTSLAESRWSVGILISDIGLAASTLLRISTPIISLTA